ncbi:DNA polymerase III, delta subunit [Beutenbergia cavernae DSM 12333]|uniref:DNA-directed DNA polymerase n=1 Tax=Beutenbergia cavernae (strain ATCC BAA-8 / DSM 12333 / CCUG 43141 / JCM 11478 / NBRC 16432 / NCIMB 13614 / HKI 0122) TaxID=471853 RepID=C5C482_BEUC1|nr:DNA polymerase III subunit delta [Beutenbergia cavernae]ACQ79995.1 DNA polymerase III, delta subunit [Beutenbergia cavernae DSM 12333]
MPPQRRPSTRGAALVSWDAVRLAPVVLVRGTEELLGDRALTRLLEQAREQDPGVEVTRLDAAGYEPGRLGMLTSPSLFGERRHVEILGLENLTEACASDVLAYVDDVAPDVTLVLRHGGGVRGKKVLDAVTASGAPVVACDALKYEKDKVAFVTQEFRRTERRVQGAAVQALVDALGSDLRELAAACAQLVADTTGTITADVVDRYYGGRVEVTGFRVADSAVAGDAGGALLLLRHAIAAGTDPVPLVAALALKLRTMAKVAAVRGRGPAALSELGLASWQVDRARRDLGGWTPEGLAAAISAVATADAEVKGESRSPAFAVERAVLRIAHARG